MPTDAEIADVYAYARATVAAETRGRSSAVVDAVLDSATDAIIEALRRQDRSRPFGPFARQCVRLAIRRAFGRLRPRESNAGDLVDTIIEQRSPCRDAEALPRDLRVAVLLYGQHGYTLRDTGHLIGLSYEGVRKRLKRAAKILDVPAIQRAG